MPAVFSTIVTDPVPPAAINGNDFPEFVSGDFDGLGATNDIFYWNPGTGRNRLVLNTDGGVQTLIDNPVSPLALNSNDFTKVVAGDFVTGAGAGLGFELFFWNPTTGKNRLVTDVDASVAQTITTNTIGTAAINGDDFNSVVAGNFNTSVDGDELFFWGSGTGKNRLVADVDASVSQTIVDNSIGAPAVNGEYTVVVAGDFDTTITGEELFFWDPVSGNNRLVTDVDADTVQTVTTNPIAPAGVNVDFTLVVAIDYNNDAKQELYFWNPDTGKNRLIEDVDVTPTSIVSDSFVNADVIDDNEFLKVASGNFDGIGISEELFFWNMFTGANIVAKT